MFTLYEYGVGVIIVLVILLIFVYLLLSKPNYVICNEKKVEGFYPVTNQPFMLEQINSDIEKNILPPYTYRQSTVAMALGDLEFGRDWVATTPSQYKNKFRSSKARNSLIRKAQQKADKADIWDPTN